MISLTAVTLLTFMSSQAPANWIVLVERQHDSAAQFDQSIEKSFKGLDQDLTDIALDFRDHQKTDALVKKSGCQFLDAQCAASIMKSQKASYGLLILVRPMDGVPYLSYQVVDQSGTVHFSEPSFELDGDEAISSELIAAKIRADLLGVDPTALIIKSKEAEAAAQVDGTTIDRLPYIDRRITPGDHMVQIQYPNGALYEGMIDVPSGVIVLVDETLLTQIRKPQEARPDEGTSSGPIAKDATVVQENPPLSQNESPEGIPLGAVVFMGVGIGGSVLGGIFYASSWAVSYSAWEPSQKEKEEPGGLVTYHERREMAAQIVIGLMSLAAVAEISGLISGTVGAGLLVSHYTGDE